METTTRPVPQITPETLLRLRPADIDALPWKPVPGCPGVFAKELWRCGDLVDALIRHEPDSATPGRPHLAALHHIWVIGGSASISGQRVTAGSYVYVPPGVAHPVHGVGPQGCLLLQLHRPHGPA